MVAETMGPVHLRSGFAGAPVECVECRINRAGAPGRGAAAFPRVALPRVDATLPVAGNRVEPPRALARVRFVRIDEAANAVLAARDSDDDLVFHDQWRASEAEALIRVRRGHVPAHATGLRIERNDVSIERAHEDAIAKRGETAILRAAAERHRFR